MTAVVDVIINTNAPPFYYLFRMNYEENIIKFHGHRPHHWRCFR